MEKEKPYSSYFSYDSFRPEQDVMLDSVWSTLQPTNPNRVIIVSAPTGSGKSSVVAPALQCANFLDKKVVIAVSTKSQISIFVEELERIRKTCYPNLKYTFLMGKSELCSIKHSREKMYAKKSNRVEQFILDTDDSSDNALSKSEDLNEFEKPADMDIYDECMIRKQVSRNSIRKYIRYANAVDSDELIDYGMSEDNMSNSGDGCPYFEMVYNSDAIDYDTISLKQNARETVQKLITTKIMPNELGNVIPVDMCPYEVCLNAARKSDVVIVNYNHIIVDNVREQLLNALGCGEEDIILIIDEAHNLGDRVRSTHMFNLSEDNLRRSLELIDSEGAASISGIQIMHNMVSKMRTYMNTKYTNEYFITAKVNQIPFDVSDLVNYMFSTEVHTEDTEDAEYTESVNSNTYLYYLDVCLGGLNSFIDKNNKNSKSLIGDTQNNKNRKSDISILRDFVQNIRESYFAQVFVGTTHIGVISLIKNVTKSKSKSKSKNETTYSRTIGVMNVDPSIYINDLVSKFYRMVLISGTLEPVNDYASLFFGNCASKVDTVVLHNHFPSENRAIYCVQDITSANKFRHKIAMYNKFVKVVSDFCDSVHGNVAIFSPSYFMRDIYCVNADYHGKKIVIEPHKNKDGNKNYTTYEIDNNYCKFDWNDRDVSELITTDEYVTSKATTVLINEFKNLPKHGIEGAIVGVCGGKMSEGIDYKGDALKGVLILGFPYGAYDMVQKAIINIYTSKYGDKRGYFLAYTLPAINKAVQAIGRLLRTETDTGVIVMADERFLYSDIKSSLPSWISSEMKTTNVANLSRNINKTNISAN